MQKRCLGLNLSVEFAAKPAESILHQFVVPVLVAQIVEMKCLCKIESVYVTVQIVANKIDLSLNKGLELFAVGRKPLLGHSLGLERIKPSREDRGQSISIGHSLAGKIFHQFAEGGNPLSARSVKAALGGQIGIGRYKIALVGHIAGPANGFNFQFGHRLAISHHRQRFHGGLRKGLLLNRLQKPFHIGRIFRPGGQLNMMAEAL